jgi:hypothetical protein
MRNTFSVGLLVCGAIWLGGTGAVSAHPRDDGWGQSPPDFGRLALYGEWEWEPDYGRVWMPHVEANWRPYWRGHWAWRDAWIWVSSDPWGDGPFHYGEWAWSRRLGWIWIPGTVWTPARVTWIISGPIVAWAPTRIHVSFGSDPRFWAYADARTFHSPIVRPHRTHPRYLRAHDGIVTRDLGRVFSPERQRPVRGRTIIEREGSWNRAEGEVRRVIKSRPSSAARGPSRDAARSGTKERRHARGFDFRSAR